jgi:microcystin degradation protein MlrC
VAGGHATYSKVADMTRRILIAGIFHETHSFIDEVTGQSAFGVRRGDEMLARRGDASTIDGFLEVADAEGWEVVPTIEIGAAPSATVAHEVFENFWAELGPAAETALATGGLDGIWLSLHGAFVTTQSQDVEGELLARLRAIKGIENLPIFGVFDLHANFTEAMATGATGLVGYRENPHIDTRAMAVYSTQLLARSLRDNVMPRMFMRNAPVMWAPPGTGTADRPMRDLEALARQLERDNPEFWAVNIIGGYAFSDVDSAGVAFSLITTGGEENARAALDALEALAVELRDLGQPREWDLDAAIDDLQQKAASSSGSGPFIIVEPADNIGGGGPGDDTAVLRAFLRHGLDNAAVIIADAAAVEALADAQPGDVRQLTIGGKGSPLGAPPLPVEARFVSRTDGRFVLEDRNSHMVASTGVNINMGPSAVIQVDGVLVLLTTHKCPPNDLGQFRSQGIVPETLFAIGVKAAVAHRRAYDGIMRGTYTVATEGPCTSVITSLPFKRLRPGVYPINA